MDSLEKLKSLYQILKSLGDNKSVGAIRVRYTGTVVHFAFEPSDTDSLTAIYADLMRQSAFMRNVEFQAESPQSIHWIAGQEAGPQLVEKIVVALEDAGVLFENANREAVFRIVKECLYPEEKEKVNV